MNIEHFQVDDKLFIDIINKYNLGEVSLFGSVLRNDFNEKSDIDFLVSFKESDKIGLFEIIDLKNDLESILNRKVDIVEKEALKNPFRKEEILKTARKIYAA
jgi:predicted nucleotidyltransferase